MPFEIDMPILTGPALSVKGFGTDACSVILCTHLNLFRFGRAAVNLLQRKVHTAKPGKEISVHLVGPVVAKPRNQRPTRSTKPELPTTPLCVGRATAGSHLKIH